MGVSGLGLMSVSVDKFDTDLLGEGELDLLAGRGSQLGLAFGDGLGGIFNLRDDDGLLFGKIFAGDTGKGDGLVDASLDGFGVGNGDIDIDRSDNGDVVSGFLGNFLAVVVSVSRVSVSVSVSGLADGDHLDIGLLLEGNLNGLGSGSFFLLLVRV